MNHRYLSLMLAALLAQSSQTQEVDKLSNLRKGKHITKSITTHDVVAFDGKLLPLGSPSLLREEDKPQRFIVKCREDQDADACLSWILSTFPDGSAKVLHRLNNENAYALAIRDMEPDAMQTLSSVLYEDPIRAPLYIRESLVIHRQLQVEGQEVPYGIEMVKAQEVWERFGARGANVRVCVLDTGLYSSHDDFNSDKITGYDGSEAVTPWNNDGEGHGTHVTGTIAAADNTRGVVGVAPDAEIYTVRVFDSDGNFYGSDIIAAAEACQTAGANVISMSLGGSGSSDFERQTLERLFADGIISVAAAGNSGDTDFSYPASYDTVLSVAAVDSNRNLASFSTRNDQVDVAAPGTNGLSPLVAP
jgi:subtilisin family serine protease